VERLLRIFLLKSDFLLTVPSPYYQFITPFHCLLINNATRNKQTGVISYLRLIRMLFNDAVSITEVIICHLWWGYVHEWWV